MTGAGELQEPSDWDLVRAAAEGDDVAFHRLVDRHAPGLFRAAMSLTKTRSDAEDLLQESLVGAYRGLARFNGKSSVKTWLTSILVRQAAKSWRKVKKYHGTLSIQAAAERDRPIDDASLEVASSSDHVDRKIDLMQVLKTLPEEYRQALVLREFQGLSYEEIAQALGIPRGTVDSRIHRARQELRDRLKSYGVESAQDLNPRRKQRDGVVEERQS
jgi:RNA polymerase sigma-70 factor (ECF subfamily)